MSEYRVGWVIDLDADTPEEAAEQALAIQRNPESIATFFHVRDVRTGKCTAVDLMLDAHPQAGTA